jgi:hypothetical protein
MAPFARPCGDDPVAVSASARALPADGGPCKQVFEDGVNSKAQCPLVQRLSQREPRHLEKLVLDILPPAEPDRRITIGWHVAPPQEMVAADYDGAISNRHAGWVELDSV